MIIINTDISMLLKSLKQGNVWSYSMYVWQYAYWLLFAPLKDFIPRRVWVAFCRQRCVFYFTGAVDSYFQCWKWGIIFIDHCQQQCWQMLTHISNMSQHLLALNAWHHVYTFSIVEPVFGQEGLKGKITNIYIYTHKAAGIQYLYLQKRTHQKSLASQNDG